MRLASALHFESPWKLSLALHGAVLFAVLSLIAFESLRVHHVTEEIPFEVIESPAPALSATKPLQPEAPPKPLPKIPPRAVFGANRNSITSQNGPVIKTGNTTAKAPDQERLQPSDADSLPIPADEFLVSRMPVLVGDIRVPYPESAKRNGIQGAVIFDLLIDEKGRVRKADLIEGPGAGLNEAASEAVRRLIFKPAMIQDRAVAVKIRYAYRFVLER